MWGKDGLELKEEIWKGVVENNWKLSQKEKGGDERVGQGRGEC